jgi:antitoxin YefM
MSVVTYTHLRENLAAVMDEVCAGRAPVIVTRQRSPSVVLVALEEWESVQETLHLLRSPANARVLLDAVARAEAGGLERHDLVEPR